MELQKGAEGIWQINYRAPNKDFGGNLTAAKTTPEIRDLTGQRLLTPTDPVQRLARPKTALMAAEFIERDGRLYVAGRMRNLSEFPACIKIAAQTEPRTAKTALTQHSGRIGAHRLLPGEDTAFRIDFEGYLKIQDQDYNAGYDPEHFSVAKISSLPEAISLDVSTTVCAPPAYKALSFADMQIEDQGRGAMLSAKIINSGTEIVSTVQLKLSYLDKGGRLAWVQPHYLQNNLLPGEERAITVALTALPPKQDIYTEVVTINGKKAQITQDVLWPAGIALPGGEGKILIDYDAMLYQPLD
jgi:hemin uptake protein HemP